MNMRGRNIYIYYYIYEYEREKEKSHKSAQLNKATCTKKNPVSIICTVILRWCIKHLDDLFTFLPFMEINLATNSYQ